MVPNDAFVKRLSQNFKLIDEISRLIFDNKAEGKFVYNTYSKRNQISPEWTKKIKEFTRLKKLVINTGNS